MNILILVFATLCVILFTRKRPIYGLMVYCAIRLLIPSAARIGDFSFNTFVLSLFLLLTILQFVKSFVKYKHNERMYLKAVVGLWLSLILLTFFSPLLPLLFQWGELLQRIGTELLPSILLMYYLQRKKDTVMLCRILVVLALFNSLYGIYTYFAESNPIYEFFNTSTNEAKDLERYATGRFGLTGIAVGIYDDKICMSLIAFLFAMFVFDKEYVNKLLRMIVFCVSLICMLLTTQRSALFCMIVFFAMMLYGRSQKIFKTIIWGIVGVVILGIANIEIINDVVSSILMVFDDKAQSAAGIGGSSSGMRMEQFLNVIKYHDATTMFTGEGYGFTQYYYSTIYDSTRFGLDQRFFGFESFLLGILMNSGIIGVIAWAVFFIVIFNLLKVKQHRPFFAMFIGYMLAILMTDVSGSLYMFFILLVVTYKYYNTVIRNSRI